MSPALLDTNAVSDLMRGDPKINSRMTAYPGDMLTSVIVRGEIRRGLERLPLGKKRTDLEGQAQSAFSRLPSEPVSERVAEEYGKIKANLEKGGLNFSDNDLWVAATALVLGATLVTRDQMFKHVPGLHVEDWSA